MSGKHRYAEGGQQTMRGQTQSISGGCVQKNIESPGHPAGVRQRIMRSSHPSAGGCPREVRQLYQGEDRDLRTGKHRPTGRLLRIRISPDR